MYLFKSSKVFQAETIEMSIKWWMGKYNMVYPYTRLFLSCKNKWSTDKCYMGMNFEKHYAKWKKPDKKPTYSMIPFMKYPE